MSLTTFAGRLKEGMEAIRASGFPFEFIREVQAVSRHGGPVISFRSGQPPNLKGMPVSPKPMSIKTKTCIDAQGILFLSGFIPDNQHLFGRKGAHWESSSEADVIRRRNSLSSSEREKIGSMPLQVPLQEIIAGIHEGQYEKTKEDNDGLYFRVPLSAAQNAAFADPTFDRSQLEFRIEKNGGVPAASGESAVVLGEVSYRTATEESFVPLSIITYEGAAVTGDADFLGVAVPLHMEFRKVCAALSPEMFAPYNTENIKELYLLFSQYILLKNLIETHEMCAASIDHDTDFQKLLREHPGVQTAGIITPYELYVMLTVNSHMAELPEPMRRGRERLIRHGAENHNPGGIATLDSNMLHIIDGKVVMTESELQLRDFYLYTAVPDKYYFHVHPLWNKEIWWPLVARQLELKQDDLMDPATIRAYQAFSVLQTVPVVTIDPVELQITEKNSLICTGDVFVLSLAQHPIDFVRDFLGNTAEEKPESYLTITISLHPLHSAYRVNLQEGEKRFFRHQLEKREAGMPYGSRQDIVRMVVTQENDRQGAEAFCRIMAHINPDAVSHLGEDVSFLMAATIIADILAGASSQEMTHCEMYLSTTDFRIPPVLSIMLQNLAQQAGFQLKINGGLYPQLKESTGVASFSPTFFDPSAGLSSADLFTEDIGFTP